MTEYLAIQPPNIPSLINSLLGSQTSPFFLPQLSYLSGYQEVIKAINSTTYEVGKEPIVDPRAIAYVRSLALSRLNALPIKLIHNGTTVDSEVYIDSYSGSSQVPLILEQPYPPANPFTIPWGSTQFIRATTVYVYQNIVVPQKSNLVWDGRYEFTVDGKGYRVSAESRIPPIHAVAKGAIENPRLQPTYVTGLAGLAKTRKFPDEHINKPTYDFTLEKFLDVNYNGRGIPPLPKSFAGLETLNAPDADYGARNSGRNDDGSGGINRQYTIAAELNGYYFVRWVLADLEAPTAPYVDDSLQSSDIRDFTPAVTNIVSSYVTPEFESVQASLDDLENQITNIQIPTVQGGVFVTEDGGATTSSKASVINFNNLQVETNNYGSYASVTWSLDIQEEGVSINTAPLVLDFTGAVNLSESAPGMVTIDVLSGSAVEVLDEGVSLTSAVSKLDFVGDQVTATTIGTDVTVTIENELPPQTGNSGKALFTNGTIPAWQFIQSTNINDSTATGRNLLTAATGTGFIVSTAGVISYDPTVYVPTTRTISTTTPLSGGGNLASNLTLSIAAANGSTNGYLTSSDWNIFNNKQNALGFTPENVANKGVALGYAPLDAGVKISTIYLPDSILGQVEYIGIWNATTNTPTIPAASTANKGNYYIVSVAGSTAIDGISDWLVGDWLISNGTYWSKVDNTDAISSFNTRTGAITLTSSDVTTALTYTPYNVTNPAGYITSTALSPYLLSSVAATTYYTIPTGTTSQYIRGDGLLATFPTIPSVGTWGGLNYPTWTAGTPFVKMTAAGTFALDANTYVPTSRQLTINGTTYDLTVDRSWTIGGTGYTLTSVKTANYTAVSSDLIPCDTSGGSFTITLPASGQVKIFDDYGNSSSTGFGVNPLTIAAASGTILGATNLIMDVGSTGVELVLVGTDWRIPTNAGGGSGGGEFTNTAIKTSSYTAVSGDRIPCNTSGGAFTITLPASGVVAIYDVYGNSPTTGFGINNLTVLPLSGTIMGGTSLILDVGATSVELELIGTDWRVRDGSSSGGGGLNFQTVTSNITFSSNRHYLSTVNNLVCSLPPSPTVGDLIPLSNSNQSSFTVMQNGAQIMYNDKLLPSGSYGIVLKERADTELFFDGFIWRTRYISRTIEDTAALWTPSNGLTLRAWYDGNDTSTHTYSSGVVLSQFRDKSGNLLHFTTGQSTYLSNQQNGLGALSFNGSSDYMRCASGSAINNGGYMAAVVLANPVSDAGACLVWNEFGNNGNYGFLTSNRSDLTNQAAISPTGPSGTEFHAPFQSFGFDIYLFGFDAGTGKSFYSVNGGTLVTSSGQTAMSNLDSTALGAIPRTSNPTGVAFSSFLFGEWFTTNGNFETNTALQDKAVGFLADRWGLQSKLPSLHPYKTTPPYL